MTPPGRRCSESKALILGERCDGRHRHTGDGTAPCHHAQAKGLAITVRLALALRAAENVPKEKWWSGWGEVAGWVAPM